MKVLVILFLLVSSAHADEPFTVGVIAPLTGGLAASGIAVKNSILLADEKYDTEDKVRFEFNDDGFDPKNSVTIAKKYISDKVGAVLIFGTPTSLAVAPITEQAGTPLLAITIHHKVIEGRKYAFKHFVRWQDENERVLAEVKKRGYKKVAVVTTVNDASLALRDGFVGAGAVQVVMNEEFIKTDTDFRSIVTRLKALKPDSVYLLLFAPQASVFMKTLRAADVQIPVFGVHNVEDPSEVEAAAGAFEGIWFVTGDDTEGGDYVSAYEKKFGLYPAMGGANAFDFAKMVIEAANNKADLVPYLNSLKDFSGAFGTYGSTKSHDFEIKTVVKRIEGDKFVTVQ